MARGAGLRKAAMMRVLVAVVAFSERNALVARLIARTRGMASFALDLLVLACEGVACLRVVEGCSNVLPIVEVMTGFALGAEASLMEVFVASRTRLGDSNKRAAEVLDLDQGTRFSRNMFGRVALPAIHTCMLSFKSVSGLFVIESPGIPFD